MLPIVHVSLGEEKMLTLIISDDANQAYKWARTRNIPHNEWKFCNDMHHIIGHDRVQFVKVGPCRTNPLCAKQADQFQKYISVRDFEEIKDEDSKV